MKCSKCTFLTPQPVELSFAHLKYLFTYPAHGLGHRGDPWRYWKSSPVLKDSFSCATLRHQPCLHGGEGTKSHPTVPDDRGRRRSPAHSRLPSLSNARQQAVVGEGHGARRYLDRVLTGCFSIQWPDLMGTVYQHTSHHPYPIGLSGSRIWRRWAPPPGSR